MAGTHGGARGWVGPLTRRYSGSRQDDPGAAAGHSVGSQVGDVRAEPGAGVGVLARGSGERSATTGEEVGVAEPADAELEAGQEVVSLLLLSEHDSRLLPARVALRVLQRPVGLEQVPGHAEVGERR